MNMRYLLVLALMLFFPMRASASDDCVPVAERISLVKKTFALKTSPKYKIPPRIKNLIMWIIATAPSPQVARDEYLEVYKEELDLMNWVGDNKRNVMEAAWSRIENPRLDNRGPVVLSELLSEPDNFKRLVQDTYCDFVEWVRAIQKKNPNGVRSK